MQALSYSSSGDWKLAMDLIENVVQIRQKTLDEQHGNWWSAEEFLNIARNITWLVQHAVGMSELAGWCVMYAM
jgi:hypothetical protein